MDLFIRKMYRNRREVEKKKRMNEMDEGRRKVVVWRKRKKEETGELIVTGTGGQLLGFETYAWQ